ncbi:MAG TPA: class I SAM-dependent methyltransferase [Steroidobacteraceae bacterium]|nr:class I SAM-dependent methyltransferase [Steroidobacteraceae bacterium]
MDTRQLFSVKADEYAASRPHYPRALLQYLVDLCPDTGRVWDCGTGSGQAAVALAEWFSQVDATDVSAQQIANAVPHGRVRYSVQAAEHTDFPDGCFSLVTVAQALHWFEFGRFWPEVQRVLRPRGILAAWTYTWPILSEALDLIVTRRLLSVIKDYWAPQNQLAWDAYATVPFPFEELAPPELGMEVSWDFYQFTAYLCTWSATRRCIEANGATFFEAFQRELEVQWGDPSRPRLVRMELFCRIGRRLESAA